MSKKLVSLTCNVLYFINIMRVSFFPKYFLVCPKNASISFVIASGTASSTSSFACLFSFFLNNNKEKKKSGRSEIYRKFDYRNSALIPMKLARLHVARYYVDSVHAERLAMYPGLTIGGLSRSRLPGPPVIDGTSQGLLPPSRPGG